MRLFKMNFSASGIQFDPQASTKRRKNVNSPRQQRRNHSWTKTSRTSA
jgi:hypothetical protein